MKAKLTLSIDQELVRFARAQAQDEKRSVSSLFSDFLRARHAQTTTRKRVRSVNDMVGSLKGYKIDDSKAGIRQAYAEKYLH